MRVYEVGAGYELVQTLWSWALNLQLRVVKGERGSWASSLKGNSYIHLIDQIPFFGIILFVIMLLLSCFVNNFSVPKISEPKVRGILRKKVKLQSRGKHLLTWWIFYFVALRVFQQSSLRISLHPLNNLSFLQVAWGAGREQTAGWDAPIGGPSERKHRQACRRLQLSAGQQRWHCSKSYTDEKEKNICLIYKEIQMGSGYKVIYKEGLPNIWGNAQNF